MRGDGQIATAGGLAVTAGGASIFGDLVLLASPALATSASGARDLKLANFITGLFAVYHPPCAVDKNAYG